VVVVVVVKFWRINTFTLWHNGSPKAPGVHCEFDSFRAARRRAAASYK